MVGSNNVSEEPAAFILILTLKIKIAGSSGTLVPIQHYRRHSQNTAFLIFRYPLGNPPLIGVTWEGKRGKCQPPIFFST